MPKTLVIFLLAVSLAPVSTGRVPQESELDRVALDEMRDSKTPGAAIEIVRDGKVVYRKAFGVSSVETNVPVTPDMLFRLGSTTKMFNGLALATLASRGKVALDAPISRYVTGLDPRVGRVTASQLLSHTAGFRDFAAPAESNDERAFAPAIKGFKGDVFFTDPGAIYSYSSAGHWLSGVVIEEVAGKPYADALDELVFDPIGMKRSTFRPLVAMTYPVAVGHTAGESGPEVIRPAANNTVMWPGGSIYSSADELARFATALLDNGRIDGVQAIPADAVAAIEAPHATLPGSDGKAFYGYGLMGFESHGVRVLQHGGFSRGYGSLLTLVPEKRFAVVVVTNRSGSTLARTVDRAIELYLGLAPQTETPSPPLAPLAREALEPYVGVYEHLPSRWEVFARDGKLFVREEGKERELVRVGVDQFVAGDPPDEQIVFVRSPNGVYEHIFLGLYSARRRAK
jgi:CubicO group peptidase (beta-lactamase class C family)